MQIPPTFGQCLKVLLKEHKLFAGKLGTELGCKADLKKALEEDITPAKRELVFQALCKAQIFTAEELELLQKALMVSQYGIKRYLTNEAIDLLINEKPCPSYPKIQLPDGKTLASKLRVFHGAQKIRILCVNSCFRSLFHELADLFSQCEGDIKMRHYTHLSLPGCDAASLIYCVSPILFDRRYLPYGITGDAEKASALTAQYISGNLLVIQAEKNGRHIESFFVIKNRDFAYEFIGTARSGFYSFLQLITEDISPAPIWLREVQSTTADYTTLLASALNRELGRATYFYGYDICYQMIPTSITLRAFRDKALFPPDITLAMVAKLEPIFEQRFQNFYHKKKDNYVIVTIDGCRQFLETGHSADHFIGFRDYTPQERLEIMHIFLHNAGSSPFLHPHLLKKTIFPKYTIIGYEDRGLTLVDSKCDYDLRNYITADIYLNYPDFTQEFKDFYFNCLIKEQCFTQAESMKALTALYDEYSQKFACASVSQH
ncbi:MAG: hypothetical protein RR816_06420 [Clostridia bacterium]